MNLNNKNGGSYFAFDSTAELKDPKNTNITPSVYFMFDTNTDPTFIMGGSKISISSHTIKHLDSVTDKFDDDNRFMQGPQGHGDPPVPWNKPYDFDYYKNPAVSSHLKIYKIKLKSN